jgi:hypothetical protein
MSDEELCPHGNLVCVECLRVARLGEPSPEAIDLLATAVGALADVDVVHLTETWTDRDGCFYGGIPEWRASLLGHLRERFAALRPDGFGVRAGSEETP